MRNWYKKNIIISQRVQTNPNSLSNLRPRESQLSVDTQKQIIQSYQPKESGGEQKNMSAVAKQYNVGIGSVRTILKKNNIPIRGKNNLTPNQEQYIFQLYKSTDDGGKGMNFAEIARHLKTITDNTVKRMIIDLAKREGYPLRENPHASKIITDEMGKKILDMYDNGAAMRSILELFGIGGPKLKKFLNQHEREYTKQNRFYPNEEEIQVVLELLQEGESLTSIGNLFGVGTSAISNWLEENGYREKLVESKERYMEFAPLMAEMYESGMTMKEIAEDLQITQSAVATALKRTQIQSRPSASEPIQFTQEQMQNMVTMYENGKTTREIAKMMGVSKHPIERILFREQRTTPRNLSEQKMNFWQNFPGGFEAYLNNYPPEKQEQIQRAIQYKRQNGMSRISNYSWYKKAQQN